LRIRSLQIENLRAIERFEIADLDDFIIIAGPNGCGKTTVLDALRLLKSAYVADEWKRWLQEFGINPERPANFHTLFRDPSKPALISATIELSPKEIAFLESHALNIAVGLRINETTERKVLITGDSPLARVTAGEAPNEDQTPRDREITDSINKALAAGSTFRAQVELTNTPRINVHPSPLAAAAFSCFSPDNLGEMEFHTSRRLYAREAVSTVSLNVSARSEERKNRFLYDLENKYKNVKSQLSEEYVAAVLQRTDPAQAPLQKSLKELFTTFFPGKTFQGVTLGPNNSLSFPVKLETGEAHDIDELSSGEKEIVYGYLWLRTGTPQGSVVLVDEPELHLNPALIQGLPAFYKENLADALNAQVWIVTHSDAILRQGVRAPGMGVYHMSRPRGTGEQQAIKIDSASAVEAAVIDLVGDLAAYRPNAKIVLVEGHKETRFDVDMIRRLFPDIAEKANFIPVGSRKMTSGVRVRLLEVLEQAGIAGRAASIADSDLGLSKEPPAPGQYHWPVYEIENFLLEPTILRSALTVLLRQDPYSDDQAVTNDLRQLAADLAPDLAIDEVQYLLNGDFMRSIKIGADARAPFEGIKASSANSQARVAGLDLSDDRLRGLLDAAEDKLRRYLASGEFMERFPGDRLLRAFAGCHGILGDHFRNACLDAAQRTGYRPPGMASVLQAAME
jgi:energy-coupling factor transporter ATP-binding protein EcfA2